MRKQPGVLLNQTSFYYEALVLADELPVVHLDSLLILEELMQVNAVLVGIKNKHLMSFLKILRKYIYVYELVLVEVQLGKAVDFATNIDQSGFP